LQILITIEEIVNMAYIKKKVEFIGVGALVELLGLVALWFFPIGTIAGIILFIIGSRMTIKYVCSECLNRLDKDVRMCPVCKKALD
jgi:hypothetical protein